MNEEFDFGINQLTGEYRHSIDAKNRLFIPAKHRELLGTTFVIAKDFHANCLRVFSLEAWKAYIAPIEKLKGEKKAKVKRFLFPNADPQSADNQGRATIPKPLLDYAGISYEDAREVAIIGCETYAEIWNAAEYEKMKANLDMEELFADLDEEVDL